MSLFVPVTMSRPRNMPAKSFLRENSLTILTIIGVCTGSVVGLILKHNSESEWSKRDIMYITFPGEIFLSGKNNNIYLIKLKKF
uniref:Uncharacterized protein n=1 Tax=Megaselia scalaris TaxID=36166 RepID=T1GUI5_MEGSC